MTSPRRPLRLLAHLLALALVSQLGSAQSGSAQTGRAETGRAQGGGAQDDGVQSPPPSGPARGSREATWPAPTAEDWAKPCLITFQRTWQDAVALSKETGKPIMVCINMDGEIASEHHAGIRYRDPLIAKLFEPYVCVIASVYRHNPRDYDEEGNRILCPRFGSVTCDEHIWIEPILYEKFLDGSRIAPRNIMVELDGAEVFDIYHRFDVASVFQDVEKGITERELEPYPDVLEDRPLLERVASTSVTDRMMVEQAYREGDKTIRRQLLRQTMKVQDVSQTDLLRMAIFGLDLELAKLAREALAQSTSESSIDLISEALRVPMEPSEREALIAALERLGLQFPRAQTLAAVHRGLTRGSDAVDAQSWSSSLGTVARGSHKSDWKALESRIDYKASAAQSRPDDAEAQLELAEASLVLAVDPETAQALAADPRSAGTYSRLMFEDALHAAERAVELGASGWRADAAVALASYYLGDYERAYALAEQAVKGLPPGEEGWNAMAALGLFAEARRRDIVRAMRANEEWPPQWLTDVHAAYSVIGRHPLGTDGHVVAHYDFLRRLGAHGQATRALDDGLARFPESAVLHDRLRGRILAEKGIDALEETYEALLAEEGASPQLEWFAGYTSIVAAEFYRRAGENEKAMQAYWRALAHYDASIAADERNRESADHYAALAIAGRARILAELGDYPAAVAGVLASFARCEEAAATLDGLNVSPVGTATLLLSKLVEANEDELAAQVNTALDALDPVLLELPAFERSGRPPGQGGSRGQRPRRGQGR